MEDMVPETFALFHLIEPTIGERCSERERVFIVSFAADLVVLGTGSKVERVDPEIRSYLQRKGISLEIQDTVISCHTHHIY